MSAQQIESFIIARNEYLSCNLAAKMEVGSPAFHDLSVKAATAIVQKITMAKPCTVEECTRLIKCLMKGPMLEEEKQLCIKAVNDQSEEKGGVPVLTSGSRPSEGRVQLQDNPFMHNYLTEEDWSCLLKETNMIEVKLHRVATRACCIGLTHPNEPTISKMASLCIASQKSPLDPQAMLGLVRETKVILRGLMNTSAKDIAKGPTSYPDSSEEFKEKHSVAYAIAYTDGEPVPCPLDLGELKALQAKIPCRSTRAGCRMTPVMKGSSSSSSSQFALAIGNMFLQQMAGNPLAKAGMPGFFGVPQIENTNQTPAIPKQALLALPDESPQQSETQPVSEASPEQAQTPASGDVAAASAGSSGSVSFPIASMVAEMQEHLRRPTEEVQIVLKRPASAVSGGEGGEEEAKSASSGRGLLFGCPKCRGSPQGCAQCRKPTYSGRRYTRD